MMTTDEQSAELELMESAYGTDFKKLDPHREFVRYSVKLCAGQDGEIAAMAVFSLAPDFPATPLNCTVDGLLPSIVVHELNKMVHAKVENDSYLGSMDLCQIIVDHINAWDEAERSKKSIYETAVKPLEIKIARFLIYFHHIMSSAKRKAIVDNALELKLGGISKTGFPGVVIIEGLLENVLEYVRRIQRLRWQQMVVRGEEVEVIDPGTMSGAENGVLINSGDVDDVVNRHRKIPTRFYELPTTPEGGGMSVVGALCKDCHIHALFMTAMKKYDSNT